MGNDLTAARHAIDTFLSKHRIAVVGVSRDPKAFSRLVWNAFLTRGYDVVPVHPEASEIDGRACYRCVQDIDPLVEAALVLTPAAASEQVVRDCVEAGIGCVWLHRGAGQGSVSPAALAVCAENSVTVVPGYCPMMFLPGTESFHRFHGLLLRLVGAYPRA